jgi:hypothetical protein
MLHHVVAVGILYPAIFRTEASVYSSFGSPPP